MYQNHIFPVKGAGTSAAMQCCLMAALGHILPSSCKPTKETDGADCLPSQSP